MIIVRRHATIVVLATIVALTAGACSGGAATVSPGEAAVGSPSAAPPSASASTGPTSPPTSTPTTAPTAKPTATPTPTAVPTPCPVPAKIGTLPSDRLVNVKTSTDTDSDALTFVFGNMSVPGPGGPPKSRLTTAHPPYTYGPSGLPITMVGEHVLQVVFQQMSIVADTGDPVFTGQPVLTPDLSSLKHAVEFDESEGVVGWYVGYDGPGCVTVEHAGKTITLRFPHAG
jgi:hypothetical protein